MEDSHKYSRKKDISGGTEAFRIYYQPYYISFDELLILENKSISRAAKSQWKLFNGFRSSNECIDVFISGIN